MSQLFSLDKRLDRRLGIALLGVIGLLLLVDSALTGGVQPSRPSLGHPSPPSLPTATPSPTPGWWAAVPMSAPMPTPELPTLPGLPDLSLGTARGGSVPDGPVAFDVVSCPGPDARITGLTRQGVWILVNGTATASPFGYFKVEFSRDGQGWTLLTRKESPVSAGRLMELNTTTVPGGPASLRLTVVKRDGNYPEPCVVRLKV